MAEIQKGKVASKIDSGVRIQPYGGRNTVTPVIRHEEDSDLKVGDIVAFVLFEDNTGIVLKKIKE